MQKLYVQMSNLHAGVFTSYVVIFTQNSTAYLQNLLEICSCCFDKLRVRHFGVIILLWAILFLSLLPWNVLEA